MRSFLNRLLHEPLMQFIIGGFFLFLLVEVFTSNQAASNNPRDIVVDQPALLNYLQFQSKAFNTEAAKEYLQALNSEDKEQLITDYVRDEVLYREALSLGLEENDKVIKRRLIQKLEYITHGFIGDTENISKAEVKKYFLAHIGLSIGHYRFSFNTLKNNCKFGSKKIPVPVVCEMLISG